MWRRLRMVLLTVILGAAVNVAVAWTTVLVRGGANLEWRVVANPRPGSPVILVVADERGRELISACTLDGVIPDLHMGRVAQYPGIPWWTDEMLSTEPSSYCVAAGWPFLSMCAWHSGRGSWHWGFSIEAALGFRTTSIPFVGAEGVLPCRPTVRGFLVNTAIYAGICWLTLGRLSVARSAAIRWINERRQARTLRCHDCGYPRSASSVCPECGAAVKPLVTSEPPVEWHALREKGPED